MLASGNSQLLAHISL